MSTDVAAKDARRRIAAGNETAGDLALIDGLSGAAAGAKFRARAETAETVRTLAALDHLTPDQSATLAAGREELASLERRAKENRRDAERIRADKSGRLAALRAGYRAGVLSDDDRAEYADLVERMTRRVSVGRYSAGNDASRLTGSDVFRLATRAARIELAALRLRWLSDTERDDRTGDLASAVMARVLEDAAGVEAARLHRMPYGTPRADRRMDLAWAALERAEAVMPAWRSPYLVTYGKGTGKRRADGPREYENRWLSYCRDLARAELQRDARYSAKSARVSAELQARTPAARAAAAAGTVDVLCETLAAAGKRVRPAAREAMAQALDGLTAREAAMVSGDKLETVKQRRKRGRDLLPKLWPTAASLAADLRRANRVIDERDREAAAARVDTDLILRADWGSAVFAAETAEYVDRELRGIRRRMTSRPIDAERMLPPLPPRRAERPAKPTGRPSDVLAWIARVMDETAQVEAWQAARSRALAIAAARPVSALDTTAARPIPARPPFAAAHPRGESPLAREARAMRDATQATIAKHAAARAERLTEGSARPA